MTNLVLITQDFPPEVGGIHSYCDELGKRFAQSCRSFTVIAPSHEGDREFDQTLPYRVIRLAVPNILLGAALIPRLPVLLRELETDVIIHAQWNTLIASAAAKRLGYSGQVICAAHGRELLLSPNIFLLKNLLNFYRKVMLTEPDLLLPVSSYTAGLLENLGVEKQRIRIIPNGTDPESFSRKASSIISHTRFPDDAWVMITTSRLVRRKGVDVVLKALAGLKQQYEKLYYLVVGDGADLENLKALAHELNVEDRVHFTGKVPYRDLLNYYASADAFVMVPKTLTPDVEGFGIVYLEANACGLAVIGSTSGGVPDAIVDGETGLIVPENNVEALQKAIITFMEKPELAQQMGANGRARIIREYNWDAISERMLHEIHSIVSA